MTNQQLTTEENNLIELIKSTPTGQKKVPKEIELLINQRTSVNILSSEQETAFMLACARELTDVVNLMLRKSYPDLLLVSPKASNSKLLGYSKGPIKDKLEKELLTNLLQKSRLDQQNNPLIFELISNNHTTSESLEIVSSKGLNLYLNKMLENIESIDLNNANLMEKASSHGHLITVKSLYEKKFSQGHSLAIAFNKKQHDIVNFLKHKSLINNFNIVSSHLIAKFISTISSKNKTNHECQTAALTINQINRLDFPEILTIYFSNKIHKCLNDNADQIIKLNYLYQISQSLYRNGHFNINLENIKNETNQLKDFNDIKLLNLLSNIESESNNNSKMGYFTSQVTKKAQNKSAAPNNPPH